VVLSESTGTTLPLTGQMF